MALSSSYYNRIILGGQPASDYATTSCLFPKVLSVRDSFGVVKNLVSDCGHCVRCQQKSMNEWSTRMILHSYQGIDPSTKQEFSSPWKYCYFVTLTYGNYNLYEFDFHPFKDDWEKTFPSFDSDNYYHRSQWTPSILVVSHIQKYLKRLRSLVSSDNKISYVYCGEYGHDFGRPHWHLIVWSYLPIDLDFFKLSWGYKIYKQSDTSYGSFRSNSFSSDAEFFSIGHVDVSDLGANGTLNSVVRVDGQDMDAKHCFMYVCKYLRKSPDEVPDSANKRWLKAYLNLPLEPDSSVFAQDRTFERNYKIYHHVDFASFKKLVRPIFSSSLRYGIGKDYFLQNRNRFAGGNFSLPLFQSKSLTFPRYYHFLLSLERCPIYFEKASLNGLSFVRSDYSFVRQYFRELAFNYTDISSLSFERKSSLSPEDELTFVRNHIAFPLGSSSDYSFDLSSVVLRTPEGVYRCSLNVDSGLFDIFSYDRSSHQYSLIDRQPISDFCEHLVNILDIEEKRVRSLDSNLDKQLALFDALQSDPHTQSNIDRFLNLHSQSQRKYNRNHKDIF